MKMDEQKIEPHKITRPIQLMAVWFVALILIDSELFTAATLIKEPNWVPPLLVISAICFILIFIGGIFLMQTVFRKELQDDPYYSKWLLGEKGKQSIPQTTNKNIKTNLVETNVKRRSLMEYMILNTLWTKQVNKWPDLSQYFTFIMNFAAPSETKSFNEATEILIKEGLITLANNGQYMLTIAGFDYCKSHYKEFPSEQWWPEEKINKENLKKVLEKSA
jgi:hypothetical protein